MKLVALDFDGVISDSAREAFAVALRTYASLFPHAKAFDASDAELYASFLELMPLGNRAEDYGVTLRALDEVQALPDQAAYDRFKAAIGDDWLRAYHKRFYEIRKALSEENLEAWLGLMRPFPILDALRRASDSCRLAIATAKDRRSVGMLLEHYGVADLFADEWVLDKEAGASKVAHLQALHARSGLAFESMAFVDDKVNHLDSTAALGVRCVLAGWGYNGPREHELARAQGYWVCSLDDFEARVLRS